MIFESEVLEEFGTNFNKKAFNDKYDPIFYRDLEIRKLMEILSRRFKNNPLLLGKPGVGKTALIENLASMINNGQVPKELKNKTIYGLRISDLVAGTSYRGEFEEKVKIILNEVYKNSEKIILFIDEIHTVSKAGSSEGGLDLANMLKPALSRGDFQLIGATTNEEYEKFLQHDKALDRRFQKILIEEPDDYICYLMIKKLKSKYEFFHDIQIEDEGILEAVLLSKSDKTKFFPDKALDLLDLACSRLKINSEFFSDELLKLNNQIELYEEFNNDPLLSNFPISSEIKSIDINSVNLRKKSITDDIEVVKNNRIKYIKNNKLIRVYSKEADSMKTQGYNSKYEEIQMTIIPKLIDENRIKSNNCILTAEIIRETFNFLNS
ncbi:AAA family ATPase [Flavobacterium sp. LHD-85]|uniref:AAA family ATPase n=1 Tax=Flavobacterium sp. LHD-85 TaxID=3071410 RepID=UPI0027E1443C|nr:AAA family ATPase [Flavobacterium sp. LHD-85]MDQ6531232.1 AAA family ATPase [Flavobacterium sp. LHD-85]